MILLEFAILFGFVCLLSLFVYYYINLVFTKHEYLRDEFTNLSPFFSHLSILIRENISVFRIVSGLLAVAIPYVLTRFPRIWLFNSIILLIVLYYVYPLIVKIYSGMSPENRVYAAMERLVSSYWFLLYLFGAALTAGFTLNRLTDRNMGLIFFAVNFCASFVFLYFSLSESVRYDHGSRDTEPPESQ
ncbi:MAG: hypothetical protein ACOCWH_02825 [Spirochaetota bacterium]